MADSPGKLPSVLVLNKPYGVQCRFTDPAGRPTLAAFGLPPGVYSIGRLDADSEGTLLFTADGLLKHRLQDPRFAQKRVYWAQVEGVPSDGVLHALRRGLMIRGRRTGPAGVCVLDPAPEVPPRAVPIRVRRAIPTTWIELVLTEGRNREVRRMTAAVGHPTLRLIRVAFGPVRLARLAPGDWRACTPAEIRAMMGDAGGAIRRPVRRRVPARPPRFRRADRRSRD